MNMNTNATQPSSPDLKSDENSLPAHTQSAPAENPVATNEFSDAAHAADLGHEPDRIQPQSAEHHPTNDHHDEPGTPHEPVTKSSEAASPSITPSELSSFAKATLDEPPMARGGLAAPAQPVAGDTADAARSASTTSTAPSELSSFAKATLDEPPMAGGGLVAPPMDSAACIPSITPSETPLNGPAQRVASGGLPTALSQILAELATETRQAAAAHGDSLRAIHGAIHELRRAHQEILSRLNQPQGQ
jgi:hypothetical protein